MQPVLPTVHDIQDSPSTHGTALREIKLAIEQIDGARPGIVMHWPRVFVMPGSPIYLPEFKGNAQSWMKPGDLWIDTANPAQVHLWYWDNQANVFQKIV
jgi:hypothetical protein